jgi:GTP-binding protein LepA
VVTLVRVVDGVLRKGTKAKLMATGLEFDVMEVGVISPRMTPMEDLGAGEVGYVTSGVKRVGDTRVGDTITDLRNPSSEPLPGFRPVRQMVFCTIFPSDPGRYEDLREALSKLSLNDSSFTYEPETSQAIGFGFRCGFLGLLHMEIVQERLEREYDLDLVTTAPSVAYRVVTTDGETVTVESPKNMPDPVKIDHVEEPVVNASIHTPSEFVGALLKLCTERRGTQKEMRYLSEKRVMVVYELPLSEIIFDFFDKLKTMTRGYGSLDYEFKAYMPADLVKLDILINGDPVDALSCIVHRDRAYQKGRDLSRKMKELIPRQQYEVAVQAAIGARVIARETVKAFRKDVTAKCYGGDITRKRKLLEKQKEGKRRMKSIGTVDIPQEAFHAVLKVD